jgi:hypothetical protein
LGGTLPGSTNDTDILLETRYDAQVSSNLTHFEIALNNDNLIIESGSVSNLYEYAYGISGIHIDFLSDPTEYRII